MVQADLPFASLPTETFFTPDYKLSTFFNDEGIQIIHIPAASTDGDAMVYFRSADVIATGDLFNMDSFPIIDVEKGGSINGVLTGLNDVLKLAIPEFRTEGGTMVIPGHGRLADSADVGYYRDMLTIIRDQVQALVDQGMTLDQVVAARPTFGYEGRFGSETGAWTTKMFIEAVYRSLKNRVESVSSQEAVVKYKALLAVAAGLMLTGLSAYAHHSFTATYDENKTIEIKGTLVQFMFRNPHAWVHVMAPDDKGEMQRWGVEWGGAGALTGQGVTRDSLKPGDEVVITGNPGRNPIDHRVRMRTLLRPSDGFGWGQKGETFD